MSRTRRSKVLSVFGAAAAAILLSSPAFACTVFKGKLTTSGTGAGNLAETVYGKNSGMNWCTLPTGSPRVKAAGDTLSLATAASTTTGGGCSNSQLSALGTYTVATKPGWMPQGGGAPAVHNCHGGTGTTVLSSTATVSLSGVLSPGSYPTGAMAVNSYSVCIFNNIGLADAIAENFKVV